MKKSEILWELTKWKRYKVSKGCWKMAHQAKSYLMQGCHKPSICKKKKRKKERKEKNAAYEKHNKIKLSKMMYAYR